MRKSGSVLEGQKESCQLTKVFRGNILALMMALIMLQAMTLPAVSAQDLIAADKSWSLEPWKSSAEEGDGQNVTALSSPLSFNLSGNEPSTLRLGSMQMNFSDYVASPILSALWVRTDRQWSQHEQIYAGNDVDLIIYTPRGGHADIYLVSYARSTINHWRFKLLDGYYLLKLTPEDSGRLFLIMALDNQPSNAVILDALAPPQETSKSPLDVRSLPMGRAKVTIKSERIKGYDVYLDGVFFSSDISDGTVDGITSFTMRADMTRTITVSQRDKQGKIINLNEHTKSFRRDTAYTLSID